MSHDTRSRPLHARTRDMTTAALITALLVVSAWIVIPAGAVPITLQVLLVVLAALLLRPGWAMTTVGLYLVLGAVGLPVFSGGRGGLGVLAGPTGGYLVGFVVGAGAGAVLRLALTPKGIRHPILADVAAATAVVGLVYAAGVVQLALQLRYGPAEALSAGVLPFIVPDAGKAVAAVVVARAVRRATGR